MPEVVGGQPTGYTYATGHQDTDPREKDSTGSYNEKRRWVELADTETPSNKKPRVEDTGNSVNW